MEVLVRFRGGRLHHLLERPGDGPCLVGLRVHGARVGEFGGDHPRTSPRVPPQLLRSGPPVEVELPWGKPEGQGRKFSLLLTTRFGNAVAVNTWNTCIWKPALAEAGIIPPRATGAKRWQWAAAPKDGFHVLRHTYASLMLEAGESVVTLARWLGQSSLAITLGYYAHFMPEAGSKGEPPSTGCSGSRGNCMPVETPQILPRAIDGRFALPRPSSGGRGFQG